MYKLTYQAKQIYVLPKKLVNKNGEYFLEGYVKGSKEPSVQLRCSDISHFEDQIISGIDIIRPLTDKLWPFQGTILKIAVDSKDYVLNMETQQEVVKPSEP